MLNINLKLGTTAFMAPEVFTAENENAYTKKVDGKYFEIEKFIQIFIYLL